MDNSSLANEFSDFDNIIEVRFYGLMRSGNHAIIDWVQNQYADLEVIFLNNVNHGDVDPYTATKISVNGLEKTSVDTSLLRKRKGKVLLYSYEDNEGLQIGDGGFIRSVCPPSFEKNRLRYLGRSQNSFDAMIIRDPFNCLASRLKMLQTRGALGGERDMNVVASNWKFMAKEAIEILRSPQPNKIVINYNLWVNNRAYRKELSKMLLGKFNDQSMEKVSHFGGGSSFPEITQKKLRSDEILRKWRKLFSLKRWARFNLYFSRITADKPISEDFLVRWKVMSQDKTYRDLFKDTEFLDLSEELFGEIPGTREFVSFLRER